MSIICYYVLQNVLDGKKVYRFREYCMIEKANLMIPCQKTYPSFRLEGLSLLMIIVCSGSGPILSHPHGSSAVSHYKVSLAYRVLNFFLSGLKPTYSESFLYLHKLLLWLKSRYYFTRPNNILDVPQNNNSL